MEMSTKSERKLLKMLNFFVLIVVIFTVGAVVFEGRFTLYKFQNKFLFEILRLGTSSQMAIFTLGLFGLVTIGNFKNKYFPLIVFVIMSLRSNEVFTSK